jgi:hypothetical protein
MSRTSVAAVVVVVALLGACSDDDPKPDIADPTPSASTSSAAVSTSPTVSATPALGPEETVRAWVEAQNHALKTGDTSGLRALSATGCKGCAEFPDAIDEVVTAGGSFEGGQWTVARTQVEDPSARPVRVNVAVRIAGGTTIAAAGGEPTNYGASSRLLVFELADASGAWLISLIGSLS